MNKSSPSSLSEVYSLVEILKQNRGGAPAKPSWPRTNIAADDLDDVAYTEIDDLAYEDLDDQLHALKITLKETDEVLAEREAKCEQQAAIIEALVHHLSEVEDQLKESRGTTAERMHRDLENLKAENTQLVNHVQNLEGELAEAKKQVRTLMFLLQKENDSPAPQDLRQEANLRTATDKKVSSNFPNRKCTSELNIPQMLAKAEKKNLLQRSDYKPSSRSKVNR